MPRSIDHIPDLPGLALRLKERREAVGLSQRQLAFEGCTAAYISRLEAGARHPSRQMIDALAERLGTTREWLETGVGPLEMVSLEISAVDIDVKMAAWFGEGFDDPVTWANLDEAERAAVVYAMRDAALKQVGGMALALSHNRKLRQERLEELDRELAGRLRKATAEVARA